MTEYAQAEYGTAADYAAPAASQPIATWRLRLAARLNVLEQLLVHVLRALYLWPALLQPPLTDDMREEMERASSLLAPHKPAAPALTATAAAGEATSAASRSFTGWSSALLHSAAQHMFPTHWHPLSFRKTNVLEPSLEPAFPPMSTRGELVACVLLVSALLWFNTLWLKP